MTAVMKAVILSVARNNCRRVTQKKAPCTVAYVQDATRCILAVFYRLCSVYSPESLRETSGGIA